MLCWRLCRVSDPVVWSEVVRYHFGVLSCGDVLDTYVFVTETVHVPYRGVFLKSRFIPFEDGRVRCRIFPLVPGLSERRSCRRGST